MGIRTATVQTAGSGCGFSAWLAASHQIRWDFIFESSERGRLVASIVSWDRQVSSNFKYLCVRSLKCWWISRPFLRISFFLPSTRAHVPRWCQITGVSVPDHERYFSLRNYPYTITWLSGDMPHLRCHWQHWWVFGRTSTSGALHCTAMPPKKQIQLQVR